MSFSAKAKNELCRIYTKRKCCKFAELAALIHACGSIHLVGKSKIHLRINTENASIAKKIYMLIKDLYKIQIQVIVRKNQKLRKNNSYYLVLSHEQHAQKILEDMGILYRDDGKEQNIMIYQGINPKLIKKKCCKKAYLRGAFLGGGSVSDPEKNYHLEFVAHTEVYGQNLCDLINEFDLHAKIIERKRNFVVYLKEGENIVNLLNIIGAHTALLNLENIRIYKDIRNNINRIVNCETANLSKTVNAAVRQIENIEYLQNHIGLTNLPPPLREIAELRLLYSDASLKELGQMLSPPIGKSGVNHRLRKLDKMAEDLKMKKGEM